MLERLQRGEHLHMSGGQCAFVCQRQVNTAATSLSGFALKSRWFK